MQCDNAPHLPSKRVILLTQPRSGSNLLEKMLSKQPRHDQSGYYFFESYLRLIDHLDAQGRGEGTPGDGTEAAQPIYDCYQASFEKLLATIEESEKAGRSTLVKEHVTMLLDPRRISDGASQTLPELCVQSPSNATSSKHTSCLCVPDTFLLTWQPIFLIRNPALMFPSFARAAGDTGRKLDRSYNDAVMTLAWTRDLYCWYTERGVQPLLVDADDVMGSSGVVREVCRRSGMEPDAVITKWGLESSDNPMLGRYKSTINGSTGIIPGKDSAGLDLEVLKRDWVDAFGTVCGHRIGRWVDESMPDYEYLREQRVRQQ